MKPAFESCETVYKNPSTLRASTECVTPTSSMIETVPDAGSDTVSSKITVAPLRTSNVACGTATTVTVRSTCSAELPAISLTLYVTV